ncbi:MAG: hypothetical protein NC830_06280 [Candidatus Omnitrophica bacterium]|nr:hypothetical protein [Candidatus Omnitrophota bacterium]
MKAKDINEFSISDEIQKLFSLFYEKFHQNEVFIIRVPARVNPLGTHIDHRGGWLNYVAVDKNFWMVGSKRKDCRVSGVNLEPAYSPFEFDIRNETPDSSFDWETAIRNIKVQPSWENYTKCAFVYLQHKMPEKKILGCNLACWGNVPPGSGLSSSSTIVTGAMIAACYANGIELSPAELVEYAGRAEWFIGTRGGWGDHAAMILCRNNSILHMQFYPFRFEYFPFFKDIKIIIANSLIEAKKSLEANGTFNQRVACYEIGLLLLKKNSPSSFERVKYLRDINPEIFPDTEKIYDFLLGLPEVATRDQFRQMLPECSDKLDILFQTHPDPGEYRIRDVFSYGIFECERSRACTEFLLKNDALEFGRLMYISHDGDRVVRYINGIENPWEWHADDRTLLTLKEKIRRNPQEAQLHLQPGRYSCSRKELDFIVDSVKEIPGVYGAKLTGAGLGGCVVILSESSSTNRVVEMLKEKYYEPSGLPAEIYLCDANDGTRILERYHV